MLPAVLRSVIDDLCIVSFDQSNRHISHVRSMGGYNDTSQAPGVHVMGHAHAGAESIPRKIFDPNNLVFFVAPGICKVLHRHKASASVLYKHQRHPVHLVLSKNFL